MQWLDTLKRIAGEKPDLKVIILEVGCGILVLLSPLPPPSISSLPLSLNFKQLGELRAYANQAFTRTSAERCLLPHRSN
jgi:hypothetical protein